jgi:AraC family transcriptional regulator of arabinose operon
MTLAMAAFAKEIPQIDLPAAITKADFGEIVYDPGGSCGPWMQQHLQLVFMHKGEAEVEVGDKKYHLPDDSVALLQPGFRNFFQFARNRPTHHSWCHLHLQSIPRVMPEAWRGLPFCLGLTRHMSTLLEVALSIGPAPRGPERGVLVHLGQALLYEFLAAVDRHGEERLPWPPPVSKAVQRITRRFEEPMQLDDVAHAAGVTSHHLVRLFRRHLKTTPMRYLWEWRVQRGVELLEKTGLSVSEIAYRVGFSSPFHFSRAVRRQLGIPPRTIRQRVWKLKA